MRPLVLLIVTWSAVAQEPANLGARAERYLVDLIRLDTSNPPGNETRVAEYLKRVASTNGISAELLGRPAGEAEFRRSHSRGGSLGKLAPTFADGA